jgi:Arylsulfotransferase (ASST)
MLPLDSRLRIGLAAACAGAAVLGLATGPSPSAAPAAAQHFWSRPDLHPPSVRILARGGATAPGYLFIAPKKNTPQAGPMIFDNRGRLVWFRPLNTRGVSDFRMQWYHGRPVLTWWQARPTGFKTGRAYYVILDARYRQIRIVRPGHDLPGDIHEFLLTRRGTALMTTVHAVRSGDRRVTEGGVQELDLRTGRVLLDWRSLQHIPLTESYSKPPRDRDLPFDYFHVNAIDVDTDGNLLVSARNTHAIYKLDRHTGRVLWRLGGKRSDYRLGRGVRFAWQHDARRQPDGTIRIFDNGAAPRIHPQTRVIFVHLDRRTMRARLMRTLVHRPPIVAINQGNAQLLPGRHMLVGWGHEPQVTEYDGRGRVLLDLRFGSGADSYRAFRYRWVGRPIGRPSITLHRGRVYVSWNGATNVARWQILGGSDAHALHAVRTVVWSGFETSAPAPRTPLVAVRALDAHARRLGLSKPLRRG